MWKGPEKDEVPGRWAFGHALPPFLSQRSCRACSLGERRSEPRGGVLGRRAWTQSWLELSGGGYCEQVEDLVHGPTAVRKQARTWRVAHEKGGAVEGVATTGQAIHRTTSQLSSMKEEVQTRTVIKLR